MNLNYVEGSPFHLRRCALVAALFCALPSSVLPLDEGHSRYIRRDLQELSDPFGGALFSEEVVELGAVLATPWREKESSSWCTPDYDEERPSGLLYVKLNKAASATTAGIAHRIAEKAGTRMGGDSVCHVEYKEGNAENMHYGDRDKARSYLWTMIRDPSDRAVSQFYQGAVTKDGIEPTDENFMHALQNIVPSGSGGYQLRFLSPKTFGKLENYPYAESVVAKVIDAYDFIGVVDRYEESVVVLRLLLGLDAGDVVFLLSRISGVHFDENCVRYEGGFPSYEVENYLQSKDWHDRNLGDSILYKAVNKKLDLTIENIGAENFKNALFEHRKLMMLVREKCMRSAVYPCTQGEDRREEAQSQCYWNDSGCGYPCIDRIVEEYDLLFNQT